jgi:putative tryptophan/tyrosine transport system substrate-binding protein
MQRREFITLLGGAAAAWPIAARAQQPDRMRRIGWLDNGLADDPGVQARNAAVRQELERLGWVVGRNLAIDYRWGVFSFEMAQQLGAELLSLSPDVIFCAGSPGVKALQQATRTVPIVFINVAEPVDQGFIQSLAHPGGNITGFAYLERTIGGKWLSLLTEIAPSVKHIAYVFSPKAAPYAHFYYESAQAAAGKMGVQLDINPVNEPAEFEPVLAKLGADGGVILNADAFIGANILLVIDLAARYRVPTIYGGGTSAAFIKAGGLISYSPDTLAQFGETAPYLDRILRGEKPTDLPVQQPTKFQLVINLKTAKALGLTVAPSILSRAEEVIE